MSHLAECNGGGGIFGQCTIKHTLIHIHMYTHTYTHFMSILLALVHTYTITRMFIKTSPRVETGHDVDRTVKYMVRLWMLHGNQYTIITVLVQIEMAAI